MQSVSWTTVRYCLMYIYEKQSAQLAGKVRQILMKNVLILRKTRKAILINLAAVYGTSEFYHKEKLVKKCNTYTRISLMAKIL